MRKPPSGLVSTRPYGTFEIRLQGTRFIAFKERPRMGAELEIGFVPGAAVVALTGKTADRGCERAAPPLQYPGVPLSVLLYERRRYIRRHRPRNCASRIGSDSQIVANS
jgi:hypothetical protein